MLLIPFKFLVEILSTQIHLDRFFFLCILSSTIILGVYIVKVILRFFLFFYFLFLLSGRLDYMVFFFFFNLQNETTKFRKTHIIQQLKLS